jgi:hypothetical protein
MDYSRWSNDPSVVIGPPVKYRGLPRATAGDVWRPAMMAGFVVLGIVMIIMGACIGAFLKISFAIRREDRTRGSLRLDAQSYSAKAARELVGMSSSRWD